MQLNITKTKLIACRGWSYENIYFFIMMIYLGMATGYTQVLCYPPSNGLWTFFVPLILTGILIQRNIVQFRNNSILYTTLFIILMWIVAQSIKYGKFEPMNLFLLYNICMAYVLCRVYGMRAFVMYEKYLTILAMISIVAWIIYNMDPSLVMKIVSSFAVRREGTLKYSLFVINFANSKSFLGYRNAGFAQEPGHWASFLIIGLFINLLLNNFNYRNKNFLVLFVALVTSQSTTGYSAFGLILLMIIYKAKRSKLIIIISSIIILPTVIALPMMRDKIEKYSYTEDSIDNTKITINYLEKEGTVSYVPQRIEGFVYEAMNFIYDPILGYGTKGNESYIAKTISPIISCSNGNIKVFSRYGIILGLFFYFFLYRSGRFISTYNKRIVSLGWLAIYLILGMSYEFTTIPLLLCFWMMDLFSTRNYLKPLIK